MPRSTQKPEPTEPAESAELTGVDIAAEHHTPVPDVDAEIPSLAGVAAAVDSAIERGVIARPEPPKPDQFGRYRVLDTDTGHQLSIHAEGLPHGNYEVLPEAASHPSTGEPLPPVHQPAVETNPSGQQAENKEELDA